MKAIVTVKFMWEQNHPYKKKTVGKCPIIDNSVCTDVYGAHHSYIEEGKDLGDIALKANVKYSHITRIEVIDKGGEKNE